MEVFVSLLFLRNPSGHDVLEPENFTNLEVIKLLLISNIDSSLALADVFIAGEYGSVDPVYYLLEFFVALFDYSQFVFANVAMSVLVLTEFISLEQVAEYLASTNVRLLFFIFLGFTHAIFVVI